MAEPRPATERAQGDVDEHISLIFQSNRVPSLGSDHRAHNRKRSSDAAESTTNFCRIVDLARIRHAAVARNERNERLKQFAVGGENLLAHPWCKRCRPST